MDPNEEGLEATVTYLRSQCLKTAEKNIVELRQWYRDDPGLVENGQMVEHYVEDSLATIRLCVAAPGMGEVDHVFEAATERLELKIDLLRAVSARSPGAWFYTNTSSIPIAVLAGKSGLGGRLVGFHFYNPPPQQKLLEWIPSGETSPELKEYSRSLAGKLGKVLVESRDVAGFIGNGQFVREGLHALNCLESWKELDAGKRPLALQTLTQSWLLRPMGILQLMDYVGLDVVGMIADVMGEYLGDTSFRQPLLEEWLGRGVQGGQHPDGSIKPGFFRYQGMKPVAVYDLKAGTYVDLAVDWQQKLDGELGGLPQGWQPWKNLSLAADRQEKLRAYFRALKASPVIGAKLAWAYHVKCRDIAGRLVADGVAPGAAEVNQVMTLGFQHLAGPLDPAIYASGGGT